MARSHGRILSSILLDPDFRTLSESAQRLYLILLAQPDLNTAGVLSINYRRWARVCSATAVEHIVAVAHELDDRRYVLLDEETEEAFVRSLIRNDGIVKQPQMLKNALRLALQVESQRLRREVATELRRLGRDDAQATADVIDPASSPPPPSPQPPGSPNGLSNGSPIQADGSLPAASAQPDGSLTAACPQVGGVGVGEGVISSHVRTSVGGAAKTRGTRIPDDFEVTPDMIAWARKNTPLVGQAETELFIEYWQSESGAKATKADWRKTWQVWMRREQKTAERRPAHLRSVPALSVPRSSDPAAALADLRGRAAAQEAANLIGAVWIEPTQPMADHTPPRQWSRDRAVEFVDAHEAELRAALAETKRVG